MRGAAFRNLAAFADLNTRQAESAKHIAPNDHPAMNGRRKCYRVIDAFKNTVFDPGGTDFSTPDADTVRGGEEFTVFQYNAFDFAGDRRIDNAVNSTGTVEFDIFYFQRRRGFRCYLGP